VAAGDSGDDGGRTAAAPDVNDVLDGRYRLDDQLKKGSTGALYVGKDLRLGIDVAVKVLQASLLGPRRTGTAKRMLQEAHVAAQLSHPAIVKMLDMGTAPNGAPYLVMELLRGDSLATLLASRGRLEPAEAVQILLPIADGLAWAHRHKVVHRNIKPENVLLAAKPEGGGVQPKLIDFGLAKADLDSQDRITKRGEALGTPEYMAPEQARGDDVTASADLWAFCVMLYKLVTGEPPFQGLAHTDVLERILHADPTPIVDVGRGDAQLWTIIERGLAKDPSKRWATASDIGTALAAWLLERGERRDICGDDVRVRWPKAAGGAEPAAIADAAASTGSATDEPAPRSAPGAGRTSSTVPDDGAAPPAEAMAARRVGRQATVMAVAVLCIVVAACWYWGVF
jgi:serine/threonine-protein kinase